MLLDTIFVCQYNENGLEILHQGRMIGDLND